jgi:hypothetical protein
MRFKLVVALGQQSNWAHHLNQLAERPEPGSDGFKIVNLQVLPSVGMEKREPIRPRHDWRDLVSPRHIVFEAVWRLLT